MPSNEYHITRFSSGLRLVVWPLQGRVSYIGAVINAGSRDEGDDRQGLAHFVEHTIFKGTGSRSSLEISSCMEEVGGELNAYTSKDETAIYTNAPAGHADRAISLIADLVSDSRFPEAELAKEREVVVEEINSYLDSPADSVFDEFDERIFEGCGLAHNILGTPESVRMLTGADCRDFIDTFYAPSNMTVYAAGPDDPERIARLVEDAFSQLNRPAPFLANDTPAYVEPFSEVEDDDNHQANTVVGLPVFGRHDPRRPALLMLNNYLGGPGMNSRLNRELRDNHGYVYAVDSSVNFYRDCGLLSIYFGCDTANVDKCLRIVYDELDRLAQRRFDPDTFEKMRRQYCGQLLVATDNHENYAMSLAKGLLYHDVVIDTDAIIDSLMQTTPDDILEVAQLLAASKSSRLTLS